MISGEIGHEIGFTGRGYIKTMDDLSPFDMTFAMGCPYVYHP